MAGRGAARLATSSTVESVSGVLIEMGAVTPLVAPLFVALKQARGMVEGASRNKEELEELLELCRLTTHQVMEREKETPNIGVNLSPLLECIREIQAMAKRHRVQGCCAKAICFGRHSDDIQRLRVRIKDCTQIVTLALVVDNGETLAQMSVRKIVSYHSFPLETKTRMVVTVAELSQRRPGLSAACRQVVCGRLNKTSKVQSWDFRKSAMEGMAPCQPYLLR